MNKVYLVAMREYVENLRTKTFWIGILFLPLILILSVTIPKLLEDVKDIRHYAVLDKSDDQWLSQEVERRSAMPDLEHVLNEIVRIGPDSDEAKDVFPEPLLLLGRRVKELSEGKSELERQKLVDQIVLSLVINLDQIPREQLTDFQRKAIDAVEDLRAKINSWYRGLSPDDAERFGSSLDKSRYVRVDIDATDEAALRRRLESGEIFAYFVVNQDAVTGEDTGYYVSNNRTDESLRSWFTRHASRAVEDARLEELPITKDQVEAFRRPVFFRRQEIGDDGQVTETGQQDVARSWAPVAFVYFLWISIFTIAQMLLTNTIEEKSNRIIEVLLSSISPLQLMAGKIAGIAAVGLTIVSSWIIVIFLGVKFVLPWTGSELPFDLGFLVRDPVFLASLVVYFLSGYLFYAALLCGIGAVCNSLKEAQNLMTPVTTMLMVPLFTMVPVAMDPNGTLARALSYAPPLTPFIMMNRAAGPPTTTEYIVTTLLLLISISVTFWAAARVFRVGILMTGKPPRLGEIWRWVRTPSA